MNGRYCWKLWERALLETSLGECLGAFSHSSTADSPKGKSMTGRA